MKITEESALAVVEWIGSGFGRAATLDSRRLIVIVRWMLVLPAAASGFFVALWVAMALGRLSYAWAFLGTLGAGLLGAPVLVVLFGSMMAPAHRGTVAWVVYSAGLLMAAVMTRGIPYLLLPAGFAGACAAGGVRWMWGQEK